MLHSSESFAFLSWSILRVSFSVSTVIARHVKLLLGEILLDPQGVIVQHPGAHKLNKWSKAFQDNKSCNIEQLISINNSYVCPLRV